jgi:hypothetical protein
VKTSTPGSSASSSSAMSDNFSKFAVKVIKKMKKDEAKKRLQNESFIGTFIQLDFLTKNRVKKKGT